MKIGNYNGRKFVYNEFLMEIYEEKGGKLVKKRDFHKWENKVAWNREYNCLASKSINRMNGFDK